MKKLMTTAVGDFDGFMWVDIFPDMTAWAKISDGETDLDAEFDAVQTCSGNRLMRSTPTVAAE